MTPSPTLLVTLLLLVAYFALLVWALRRQKQIVQGPWLFFLRAFFPNWKFYHAVGRPPRLYVRGQADSGEWGIWQQVYPRRQRKLWHLVHNADVNLAPSHQNLVPTQAVAPGAQRRCEPRAVAPEPGGPSGR